MLREKSDREQPGVRLAMCESSPLGLSHTQNHVSGRPRVAEMLLLGSPPGTRTTVSTERKKIVNCPTENSGRLRGRNSRGLRGGPEGCPTYGQGLCIEDVGGRKGVPRHYMEGSPNKQGAFTGCTCPREVRTFM